tara:strand:+ start:852 stop:1070 length:219 start_codon:yes stop_codon:yes gene_type:complete
MTIFPPQCIACIHYNSDDVVKYSCKAFPDRIPDEILEGEHDHKEPFKGDHGIRFEQREDFNREKISITQTRG